jgi:hypothetical protein
MLPGAGGFLLLAQRPSTSPTAISLILALCAAGAGLVLPPATAVAVIGVEACRRRLPARSRPPRPAVAAPARSRRDGARRRTGRAGCRGRHDLAP